MDLLAAVLVWLLKHGPIPDAPPALEPKTLPQYYDPLPTETPILSRMHALRFDGPRLFARPIASEIWLHNIMCRVDTLRHESDFLKSIDLMQPCALEFQHYLSTVDLACQMAYAAAPHAPLTDVEISLVVNFLNEANHRLFILKWTTVNNGYALVFPTGDIMIPESHLTGTGACDRAALLHEVAHYCQHVYRSPGQLTYSAMFGDDAGEFVPYIVESMEKIRQGWTANDFETLNRWTCPMQALPLLYPYVWPRPIRPHMDGALFYKYVMKYGPALYDANIDYSCRSLTGWVRTIESLGYVDYRTLIPELKHHWLLLSRYELLLGHIDPLASTCQTYLAINGAPSIYPLTPAVWSDEPYTDEPAVDVERLLPRVESSRDAGTRALKFWYRLHPRAGE